MRVDCDLAVAEVNRDLIPDVVFTQLAKALVDRCDGRLSGRDLGLVSRLLLLLRRQLRLLLLQLRLLLGQFLLLLLSLLLNRSHPSLNVGSGLEILAIELDGARYQLILGIVVPLYVDLKAGLKSGHAHLLLASVEQARYVFRLSVGREKDDHVSHILSLNCHGGAIASINDSLDLRTLSNGGSTKQQNGRQWRCR